MVCDTIGQLDLDAIGVVHVDRTHEAMVNRAQSADAKAFDTRLHGQ